MADITKKCWFNLLAALFTCVRLNVLSTLPPHWEPEASGGVSLRCLNFSSLTIRSNSTSLSAHTYNSPHTATLLLLLSYLSVSSGFCLPNVSLTPPAASWFDVRFTSLDFVHVRLDGDQIILEDHWRLQRCIYNRRLK